MHSHLTLDIRIKFADIFFADQANLSMVRLTVRMRMRMQWSAVLQRNMGNELVALHNVQRPIYSHKKAVDQTSFVISIKKLWSCEIIGIVDRFRLWICSHYLPKLSTANELATWLVNKRNIFFVEHKEHFKLTHNTLFVECLIFCLFWQPLDWLHCSLSNRVN